MLKSQRCFMRKSPMRIQRMGQIFFVATNQVKTGCKYIKAHIATAAKESRKRSVLLHIQLDGMDVRFEQQCCRLNPTFRIANAFLAVIDAEACVSAILID